MPVIEVKVKNKIACLVNKSDFGVCGNSDYEIRFDLDSEWNPFAVKTAVFAFAGGHYEVAFSGSSCLMPAVYDSDYVLIGLFAGNIHTTTGANLPLARDVRAGLGQHVEPPEDVYNQLLALLESGAIKGATFTPSVSETGVISWTNDKDLPNPEPRNIKGEPGDDYVLTEEDKEEIAGMVDKESIGLGNVDNTSDLDKPISTAVQEALNDITEKIPTQATEQNKLADRDFVNSSINSVTAFYITADAEGNGFETYAELEAATVFYSGGEIRVPTRNDYCIVREDETQEDATTRYIHQNGGWEFQYVVNETALTSDQLKAINSGITAELVTKIQGAEEKSNKTNVVDSDSTATQYPSAKAVYDAASLLTKEGLTGASPAWTDEEKKSSQNRIGISFPLSSAFNIVVVGADGHIASMNLDKNTWAGVQNIVRVGLAPFYFHVGYEFTTYDSDQSRNIVWVVRDHDHHTAANSRLEHI